MISAFQNGVAKHDFLQEEEASVKMQLVQQIVCCLMMGCVKP